MGYVVTTPDGREYEYPSFEEAVLAARMRFAEKGYAIRNSDGGIEVISNARDKERR